MTFAPVGDARIGRQWIRAMSATDGSVMPSRSRNLPIVGALLVGIGLIVAPAVFQMFGRAPLGGDMIDDFEPYMTVEQVERFRGYLEEIDAANTESVESLRDDLVSSGAIEPSQFDTVLVSVVNLNDQWPTIDADMTDLIDRMEANLDNYAAVAALPPFPLFPWFFVIPGAAIAVAASVALYQRRDPERRARPALWVLFGLGVAVAVAPVAFQMFDRAPKGAEMIDDFRPMMTRERVQAVQGYFVTLGAAEGQLRANALPLVVEAGGDAADYPAITQWSSDWPTILTDFNPMVATMSDNVDNYEAVDALPSFDLFPWFFVVPGALVAILAVVAMRSRPANPDTPPESPNEPVLAGKESS
jgi:hypothetical protein